ncbi:MAG TPA: amino acid permease [Methanomassiliicoccales archaeon]|jgi:amino acid transporter|nr:amino acid permease [Methanomassiliicoccales archaeon]
MTERVEVGVKPSKAATGEVEVTLRRDLGLLEVLMIGIGPNIGSSIFVLIGFAVGIAGPAIILAFILNFFVTLLTAMSYAELSSAFPETGGGYLWIQEGLPAPFGFLGGWMSWVGHCIACAVYALGFGVGVAALLTQYNVSLFGLSSDDVGKIFAVLIAAGFIYLNYRGVKGAGRSEVLVSVFLIGIIVIYILFCVGYVLGYGVAPDAFTPFFLSGGLLSVATSMAFTFMIFEGYEVVAQTGEEAKDPEKTVPRAMFLCISISCLLFVIIAVVTLAVLGWQATANAGANALIEAAAKAVPFIGGALISVGIIIGSIAAVNSIVFSASRVSFAMGRDGNLPYRFGKLHRKNQTPSTALIVSGTIIILFCVLLPLNSVASVADILILILFTFVNVAAITLRVKRPEVPRHFITPWFPLIPIAGILTKLFLSVMLFTYEPIAWYLAFVVMFIGLLLHYFAKGRKEIEKVTAPERTPLTAKEKQMYRVLIPVEDPKHLSLVEVGATIASARKGELLLISVVEVPMAVPLDAVDKKLVDDRVKMLEKLKNFTETRGVVTRAMVMVSHEVVTAIIDTAKEESVNTILIGWKGYTRTQKRIFGRKVDDILRQTPCDVIFLKAEDRLRAENVLVLSGGLWHVSSATEVAARLAKAWGGRVTILNAIINEGHLAKAREYAKRLTGIVEREDVQVITKEVYPETIVGGVVAESLEFDLLVMGAGPSKGIERFAFGPIQDKIVKNAKCPVLVFKRTVAPTPEEKATKEEEDREELEEEKVERQHERSSGSRP